MKTYIDLGHQSSKNKVFWQGICPQLPFLESVQWQCELQAAAPRSLIVHVIHPTLNSILLLLWVKY